MRSSRRKILAGALAASMVLPTLTVSLPQAHAVAGYEYSFAQPTDLLYSEAAKIFPFDENSEYAYLAQIVDGASAEQINQLAALSDKIMENPELYFAAPDPEYFSSPTWGIVQSYNGLAYPHNMANALGSSAQNDSMIVRNTKTTDGEKDLFIFGNYGNVMMHHLLINKNTTDVSESEEFGKPININDLTVKGGQSPLTMDSKKILYVAASLVNCSDL